jgi:antitoxin MazE
MQATVQKWGNSLAVRIPKPVADDVRLAEGKRVDLSLVGGKIVINPRPARPYRLDDLLKGITKANRHGEIPTGPVMGKEVW